MTAQGQSPQADLDFGRIDPRYLAFIGDYLGRYGLDADRFCRPLPGEDEMFFKAILPNYEQDLSIAAFKFTESTLRHFDAYRQVVDGALGGFDGLGTVLDFASGWGRLTRVLEQRLEPRQIFVGDIYHDAIAWQEKTFGVTGVYSAPDPDGFEHAGGHDLVFVGSMFSHLPDGLFQRWLAKLHGFLGTRGVLAFSVHDQAILPAGQAMDPSGLTYLRFSESGSLDLDIYGMSYVTEAYVGRAIEAMSPGASWRRFPKGLYENQDLYVVGAPGVDLSGLRVASTPMGGFETATALPTGQVEYAGWALERTPGQAVERVVVHVDGAPALTVIPDTERPDVLAAFPGAANAPVGWRFRLEAPAGAMIRLHLESGSGLTGYAYAQAPGAVAMTYSGWSRRKLR